MPKGVYASASAMLVESRQLEATARNIAHAQTPGFRREGLQRVGFAEMLNHSSGVKGAGGAGVTIAGSYRDFRDGVRDPTGNPLDIALHGDGFLAVADANGRTWLTRNGNLNLDAQGRLITREGHFVLGQGGPITIPEGAEKVVVDSSGTVSIESTADGAVTGTTLDQLRIVTVATPRAMATMGGIYFDPGTQPLVDAEASVHQGQLERSNSDPVDELVQLVILQRRFDAAQKALTTQTRAGEGFSDVLRGA